MNEIVLSKNIDKFRLNSENTHEVLGVFLREPEKIFKYPDLRVKLPDTSESQIRLALQGLERLEILEASVPRGRPPKSIEDSRGITLKADGKRKEYHISNDIKAFEKALESYPDDKIELFLGSQYVNSIIKEKGFLEIYYCIKDNLERSEFRMAASRALLGQEALIKEYKNYKKYINDRLQSCGYDWIMPDIHDNPNVIFHPPVRKYDLFGPLSDLNLLNSIIFYREKIGTTYIRYYRFLFEGNYLSEGMKKYVDLDIHLSPLTSYPTNDPILLLFAKPFERLYDDIYIIGKADYNKAIKRAYIVYSQFSDILFSGIDYLRNEESRQFDLELIDTHRKIDSDYQSFSEEDLDVQAKFLSSQMGSLHNIDRYLEVLVRSSIFYWNAASRRLDTLFNGLGNLMKINKDEKYHIVSDNRGPRIIDLTTNERILISFVERYNMEKYLTDPYFLLDISMEESNNPFFNLRSCHVFYERGLKLNESTYDDILAEVRLKFSRYS